MIQRFKTAMLFFFCLAALACSGVDPTAADTAEQGQLLTCSSNTCRGSVTNGVTSLPSENTYFCHPLMMSGDGAHSQSPIMQWDIPARGAAHGLSPSASSPSMAAIPNAASPLPHAGSAIIEAQCDRWTNFQAGAGNGYSGQFSKMWTWQGTNAPEFVSATELLWDTNSVCWLNGLNSHSVTGEKSWLDVPNGWNWGLNTQGWKELGSHARCAWLGHAPNWNASRWLLATPGNPHDSGMAVSAGICLPYAVYGNLDDGHWFLKRSSGNWVLEVGGGVTQAQAYCIPYN